MSSWSLVIGYNCDWDIGCSCQCAEGDGYYCMVAVFLQKGRRKKLFIYLERYFGPLSLFSSLYVLSDDSSMLFSYLFTTSLCLPHRFPYSHSAVGHILLIVPVLCGDFPPNSCDNCWRSYCDDTTGSGKNGRNFLYCGCNSANRNISSPSSSQIHVIV